MEKKWIRKPFDIELAKKIQSGEIEGSIVTETGHKVRIVCTNVNSTHPIVAVITLGDASEFVREYDDNGNNTKYSAHLFIELQEEPKHKFKVGDFVKINGGGSELYQISSINGNYASFIYNGITHSTSLDNLQYVEHKFKPFDKVLVYDDVWRANFYSHYDKEEGAHMCTNGIVYSDCIPYEGNERLVGTTDKPKED